MGRVTPLKKFADSRGWSLNDIYSMFSPAIRDAQDYQINYSILYPGIVKAWHRHKHQDDYFCVIHGMAQVGVYCEVTAAAGGNPAKKYFIGEHNPAVVHIKAGEWHGITALGTQPCGLLYLVTKKYNPRKPDEERTQWNDFVGSDWWQPEYK